VKRLAIGAPLDACGLVTPAVARADHLHVAVLGNGSFVILAQAGHERDSTLPDGSL
jgi:hypothetical protein